MSKTCAYENDFGQHFAGLQHIPAPQARVPMLGGFAYNPHALSLQPPTGVHVCVEGVPFQYQLTEDDLMKVFSRYGVVSNITVMDEGGSAVVQYSLPADAAKAQSCLDGKVLNGVQGALRVTLFPSVPAARMIAPQAVPTYQRKYTCRFEIPPDIERDFSVAKRIIGQKGVNMKKIVAMLPSVDSAKLRLRGRGSGFLEGPLKQESNEPLHLCISCRDGEAYSIVIREVNSLFEEIGRQYADWCKERSVVRTFPKIHPKEHHDSFPSPYTQAYHTGGPQLYPPNWEMWKQASINREYGRTPSPLSYSTHPGASAATTPPDVVSPSTGGARCALDNSTIERMIEERNEARRVCNFKEADRIRDLLRSHGVGLMDEPGARGKGSDVTSWRFGVKRV
jgi:hypothetical protein